MRRPAAAVGLHGGCAWTGLDCYLTVRQVGMLSGGERNRCHLAKMVKRGNNLIMVRREALPSEGAASPLGSLVGLRSVVARAFRTHFVRKPKTALL